MISIRYWKTQVWLIATLCYFQELIFINLCWKLWANVSSYFLLNKTLRQENSVITNENESQRLIVTKVPNHAASWSSTRHLTSVASCWQKHKSCSVVRSCLVYVNVRDVSSVKTGAEIMFAVLLTTWSRVILEKLLVVQLVKFSTFHVT
jgi:hypothetical protein